MRVTKKSCKGLASSWPVLGKKLSLIEMKTLKTIEFGAGMHYFGEVKKSTTTRKILTSTDKYDPEKKKQGEGYLARTVISSLGAEKRTNLRILNAQKAALKARGRRSIKQVLLVARTRGAAPDHVEKNPLAGRRPLRLTCSLQRKSTNCERTHFWGFFGELDPWRGTYAGGRNELRQGRAVRQWIGSYQGSSFAHFSFENCTGGHSK